MLSQTEDRVGSSLFYGFTNLISAVVHFNSKIINEFESIITNLNKNKYFNYIYIGEE